MAQSTLASSSNIEQLDYDPATRLLTVTFVRQPNQEDSIYEYRDVSQGTFDSMKQAASKGRFLNQEIKGKHEYRRVTKWKL